MSLYSYKRAREIEGDDFYGIIMAAMMKADGGNMVKLIEAWPETYIELVARRNAPQGLLPGECNPETGDTREGLDEVRREVGFQ